MLPRWVLDGTREESLARLLDQSRREEVIAHGDAGMEASDGWAGILIGSAGCDQFHEMEGLSVSEAAQRVGLAPGALWIELLIASRLEASMVAFTQSQEETDRVLDHRWGMVGSDAALRSPEGPTGEGKPHPRGYGSFARYLRHHVRERRSLTIEEAVRKITSLPARMLGFRERGELAKGMVADVTVFDIGRVDDPATFAQPHQLAKGFRHVIVAGMPVIRDGRHTGATPGEFIERG